MTYLKSLPRQSFSACASPRGLAIVLRPISDLIRNPSNPRLHSDRQVQQIAQSITAFGFNVPVLVDKAGHVIAGHGRLAACELLGWKEVPTITLEHLSATQARAFMIADNRLTDTSVWDERLLAEQLQALSAAELDFDLEAIGFDLPEIDLRIQSLTAEDPATTEPESVELPAVAAVPISKIGDLWQLGLHRALCGDALEAANYERLMEGQTARVVFTDPPFNVRIGGHVSGNGAIHHREFAMASGEMDEAAFTHFLTCACRLMAKNSMPGALHYVCMDWRHLSELLAAGAAVYGELKNLCVWAKDNAGMGSLYRSQHELILVFKHGTDAHVNNIQLGVYGRNRSNVWNYAGVNSFARSTDEGNLLALHPTVKPLALVADVLMDASDRHDVVLDPFLGSGTTLIAAEKTGRVARAIEIDPRYVDVAIRRWQRWTGQVAIHVETGRTFDEIARELEVMDTPVQESQP
jgi:DNA modification methylase